MLRIILFVIVVAVARVCSFAQMPPAYLANTATFAEIIRPEDVVLKVVNEQTAADAIRQLFPMFGQSFNSLKLISSKTSLLGTHMLFAHMHQGVVVHQSTVKINIATAGAVLTIISNLKPLNSRGAAHNLSHAISFAEPVYVADNGLAEPLLIRRVKDESGVYTEQLLSQSGEVLTTRDLDLFAGRRDTVVQTRVFFPDPLTTAQKSYGDDGGLWVNKNGGDYVELNAERKSVPLTIEFENDTFYTANAFAIIADIENPPRAPYKSKVNNFDFKRSEAPFREVMSLYHIARYRGYLSVIGMPFADMFRVGVDIDAYQGQDQSRFSYMAGNPGLFFGAGGVPDAEDADVIVHEYTHAVSYHIAPNTTTGHERLAVEEGTCDFMACQYSKEISAFRWREVFNWDGHNDYWVGRSADSPGKYPKDLNSSDFYKSSAIWSSMLNDLSLDMHRDVLTRILLQSMYSYTDNISMQQAAEMLVAADSLLYGKMHYGPLKYRLIERGFDISASVDGTQSLASNVSVVNTLAFANGTASLRVVTPIAEGIGVELLDMGGKRVLAMNEPQQEFVLSPAGISPGIYLLRISSGNQEFITKITRFN